MKKYAIKGSDELYRFLRSTLKFRSQYNGNVTQCCYEIDVINSKVNRFDINKLSNDYTLISLEDYKKLNNKVIENYPIY